MEHATLLGASVRAQTHLLLFRSSLLGAFALTALHCAPDEEAECGCESSCGMEEAPPPALGDDDDSAAAADDDDSAGDDDDATPEWDATAGLPPCAGSVLELEPGDPGAPYAGDGEDLRDALAGSFDALLAGEAAEAWANARLVGYGLCRGTEDELGVAAWFPQAPGLRAATVLWRAVGARAVGVGVPRPGTERVGREAGLRLFAEGAVRVLVLGETEPCESDIEADCGSSAVCGADGPVRRSDMERSEDTVYQEAHAFFVDAFPEDRWLSLVPSATPGLSVSDGTEEPVDLANAESDPAVMRVFDALEAAWPDSRPVPCNAGLGVIPDPRECGTDNRQGRLVNGALAVCGEDVPESRGRFVHLAVSESLLDEAGRLAGILAPALLPAPE